MNKPATKAAPIARFTKSAVAMLCASNPDAIVVFNEWMGLVLGVAASEQDAADIAADYRARWGYASTFIVAANF